MGFVPVAFYCVSQQLAVYTCERLFTIITKAKWGWSLQESGPFCLELNTCMADAIHSEGGRTLHWTYLLLTWPVNHLQFPALTALTPATVMSYYHDNLPQGNIAQVLQEVVLFSEYWYEKDAIVTLISSISKVPKMVFVQWFKTHQSGF